MIARGMAHGRFQGFHLEHLQYILTCIGRCENLVIGITNPDPSEYQAESTSDHRHRTEDNPFSYFQRCEMIRQSLADERIDPARVVFTPFHVFDISKWAYYLPAPQSTVQFVRAFSAWEEKKIALFESHGFRVEVFDRGARKNIEGREVRERLCSGGDWRSLVPHGTARVIEKIQAGNE
jgi:cytidyltransferase-like protein